jgi:hypothetical protein
LFIITDWPKQVLETEEMLREDKLQSLGTDNDADVVIPEWYLNTAQGITNGVTNNLDKGEAL